MIEEEGPLLAPSDHNRPPEMLPRNLALDSLREWLSERIIRDGKTMGMRKSEFLRAAGNAKVRNREEAAMATDLVKLAGEVWDEIEAERRNRSNPYRETAIALKNAADNFWADVADEMDRVRGLIDTWADEEDKRIAEQAREQEEEMRRRRAAAAPAAPASAEPAAPPAPAAPAPAPTPAKRRAIHTDYGNRLSARVEKVYSITDVKLLPEWILQSPKVAEAILAVAKATGKHMGEIPGIAARDVTKNDIR